jgi:RsiW-degrading membrane proteinase PrsW (M82 family)
MNATEYASLGLHVRRRAPLRQYVLAVLLAFAGGFLGIIGAAVQEVQAGGWLLLPLIGAPIIEEAMKPVGVYIALIRWPAALSSRLFTAALAAVGGFVFGIIEAIVYTEVYVSDPSDRFVLYRFTFPLALHTVASFVYGLGISRGIIDWAAGRSPFPKRTQYFFLVAVLMHAAFNTSVLILDLTSAVDFE